MPSKRKLESLISKDLTALEIANELGIGKSGLRYWLEKYELSIKCHGNRTVRPIREKIISLIKEQGPMTSRDIQDKLDINVTYNSICRSLRRWEDMGLLVRSGLKVSFKKGHNGATVHLYVWKINEK